MFFRSPASRPHRGYSLVEVCVAGGVLLMGAMAAASLSLQITKLEETNLRALRAQSIGEAAGRLWQLGLSPNQITSLLLYENDPCVYSLSVNPDGAVEPNAAGTPTSDLGTFEQATVTVVPRTQDVNVAAGQTTLLHSNYIFYPVR